MNTVRDDDGKRYLLLKRSSDASLVRDPISGNSCYVRNDRLEAVEGESVLETAADGVSEPVRRLLRAVHDDRTLGLAILVAEEGPLSVRSLLEIDGLCESDLNGTLAELTAAGLVEEATVDGERGYRATEDCRAAVERLRRTGQGAESGEESGETANDDENAVADDRHDDEVDALP